MKPYLKLVPVLLLLVFGAVVSGSAMARGGHGGGHGGGGHVGGYSHGGGYGRGYGYGGRVGLGIALGVPLYGLGYYSNPYYSYPDYAYPDPAYAYPGAAVAPSGGYVEQGVPQAAPPPTQAQPQPQGDWHFCAASNAYYPYVRECPGGWQRVPAQPPR